MTDTDIVTRLRAVLHNDRSVELMNREAADEIERLRAQIAAWNLSSQHAARDLGLAADEIEMLRTQRDEARREICRNEADELSMELGGEAIFAWWCAKKRGWDCFSLDQNGTMNKP